MTELQFVIDLTPPAGVTIESLSDVAVAVTTTDPTTDGYEVKLWGDDIGISEGDAEWQALAESYSVSYVGGGLRTVHARMRDDVWNVSDPVSLTIDLGAIFQIEIDTTAPEFTVEALGAPSDTLVHLALASDASDIADVKVWGQIDPTDPGNAPYGESEAGAQWIPWSTLLDVRVIPGGATLNVRVRDDVWNVSEVRSITVGGVVPPPVAPPTRTPFGPAAPSSRRLVVFTTRVAASSRLRARRGEHIEVSIPPVRSTIALQSLFAVGAPAVVRSRSASDSQQTFVTTINPHSRVRVNRVRDDRETEAALLAFGVI